MLRPFRVFAVGKTFFFFFCFFRNKFYVFRLLLPYRTVPYRTSSLSSSSFSSSPFDRNRRNPRPSPPCADRNVSVHHGDSSNVLLSFPTSHFRSSFNSRLYIVLLYSTDYLQMTQHSLSYHILLHCMTLGVINTQSSLSLSKAPTLLEMRGGGTTTRTRFCSSPWKEKERRGG